LVHAVGVGGYHRHLESRARVQYLLAPDARGHHRRGHPAAGGEILVVPIPSRPRRGRPRAIGEGSRILLLVDLGVAPVTQNVGMLSTRTGDVHPPAAENLVLLVIVDLDGHRVRGRIGQGVQEGGVGGGETGGAGAQKEGVGQVRGTAGNRREEVGVAPSHLHAVDPYGFGVVRDAADLDRGGGTCGKSNPRQ